MSNDTSTLNGALQQLGETLATNISSKGVSASASDGLTTLANKVLDISHSVSVKVVWVEPDGDTSRRPSTLNMGLRENNIPVAYYILNTGNEWSATVYYLNPSLTYTWLTPPVSGYNSEYSVDEDLTIITYTKRGTGPTTISKGVNVQWDDLEDPSSRPSSLDVTLKQGSTTIGTYTLNNDNGWGKVVHNLDASLTYTWQPQEVTGYNMTSSVDGDLTIITYTKRGTGPTPSGE